MHIYTYYTLLRPNPITLILIYKGVRKQVPYTFFVSKVGTVHSNASCGPHASPDIRKRRKKKKRKKNEYKVQVKRKLFLWTQCFVSFFLFIYYNTLLLHTFLHSKLFNFSLFYLDKLFRGKRGEQKKRGEKSHTLAVGSTYLITPLRYLTGSYVLIQYFKTK